MQQIWNNVHGFMATGLTVAGIDIVQQVKQSLEGGLHVENSISSAIFTLSSYTLPAEDT